MFPDLIRLALTASSGPAALEELVAGLRGECGVSDAAQFHRDLLERQRMGINCLTPEIAFPHARSSGVSRLVLAVGRSSLGVAFGPAAPAVRLVILVGAPPLAIDEYLQFASQLVRGLRDPAARSGLLAAADETALRATWQRIWPAASCGPR